MLVIDASVLAPALADDAADGDAARARLRGERLTAPDVIDLEVASVLRRQLLVGDLDPRRAALALADLVDLPVRRVPHRRLLARCWELTCESSERQRRRFSDAAGVAVAQRPSGILRAMTVYDAAYVALAELLDLVLVTSDVRLSNAPGVRCRVEVLS